MHRPDAIVSSALLVIAVVLVALLVAILALPGLVADDTEALTMLGLSLLLVSVLLAATVWG